MRNKLTLVFLAAGVAVLAGTVRAGELLQDASGTQLRLSVTAKQTRWAADTEIELDAVLTNSSAAAFRVDTFGDLNALYQGKRKSSYIASCWALVWEPQVRSAGPQQGKAPLSPDQLVLLNPGQAYSRPLTWRLQGVAPGRYRVRLAYAPRVASPSFNFPEHWLRQQGIAEPVWTGMIFSEALDIEVVSDH